MRKLTAIWAAKIVILIGRISGKQTSAMPGSIALKICPDILKRLAAQMPRENIVAVCGTNGKTTTNNLIKSILESRGHRVVCNSYGANMLVGVVSTFIEHASLLGKIDAQYATLEIDEASAVKVFPFVKPKYMVVTNFFRDQMDRYGEIDMTMDALKKAVELVPDLQLVINGDDPLAYWFSKGAQTHTFGVSEQVLPKNDKPADDGRFCKECGGDLEYTVRHYSQLGSYTCTKCGYKRPTPEFEVTGVSLDNGLAFKINGNPVDVKYRGFYNIYNIVAAYAVTSLMGVDLGEINKVLSAYKPQNGRMEQFNIGKPVILNLSKNPAGFNQAIETLLEDGRNKSILFAINDNAGDGRDVSWLWDVDFERVSGLNRIGIAGVRHNDMAVRLKYGEFDMNKVIEFDNVDTALESMIDDDSEVLYALVNYTVLFGAQDTLKKLQAERQNRR